MIYSQGIAYFTNNNAAFASIVPAKQPTNAIPKKELDILPYSTWGNDNLLPKEYADDIENCGVLGAVLESKARLAVGKGIQPYLLMGVDADGTEQLVGVMDKEILDFIEYNKLYECAVRTIHNILAYGFSSTQLVLNNEKSKIARVTAADVYNVRLEKMNDNGIINHIYINGQWDNMATADLKNLPKVVALQEGNEYDSYTELAKNNVEIAMLHRRLSNGKLYYPQPLWRNAAAWVKIARSVPAFKNALHENQMSIKYLITISDYYWTKIDPGFKNLPNDKKDEKIKAKYKEINDFLTGEKNAGKSIVSGSYIDPHNKVEVKDIQIEVLDDKHKDGKMLPDNAAADKQIAFSNFYNPAIIGGNLLGDGASGGAGSGSDIREATLVQMMLMHVERSMALEVLSLVKRVNGWAERLEVPMQKEDGKTVTPRLVFRFQNSFLTTLDTGKQTANTAQ